MKIRKSTPQDMEQYTELLQQTYQDAYTNEDIGINANCFSKEIFANNQTQKYLKSHLIDTATQKTLFAFIEDKLVGSITCILRNDDEAEISGFYVHPKHQRKGIGKKLYKLALTFAGDKNLLLDLYFHNTKAIKIYKKWGWEIDTTRGKDGYFNRHWAEWPDELQIKCMFMKLEKRKIMTK